MAEDEAQAEGLDGLQDDVLLNVLQVVLQSRPQVLQSIVSWALPEQSYAPLQLLTANRFEGIVKKGSVGCPEATELFAHEPQLAEARCRGLAVGKRVSFAVVMDEDGRPHAFDLSPADSAPVPAMIGGRPVIQPRVAVQMSPAASQPSVQGVLGEAPATSVAVRGITDRRFDGHLVKWNSGGGFGFIECPAVSLALGAERDVFLHSAQVGSFKVGDKVSFGVFLNKDGNPQAKDLLLSGGPPPRGVKRPLATPAAFQPTVVRPRAPAYANAGPAWAPQVPEAPPTTAELPGVTDRLFTGTLTSWNEGGGFGFIEHEELKAMFGKDVFLHRAQRNGFPVGVQVSFEVFLNKDGRPQAKNLNSASEAPRSSMEVPGVTDRSFVGEIVQFNEKGGFGFIACPDLHGVSTSDVFLHRAQRGVFGVGQSVLFEVFLNKDGKPQAKNLRSARAP